MPMHHTDAHHPDAPRADQTRSDASGTDSTGTGSTRIDPARADPAKTASPWAGALQRLDRHYQSMPPVAAMALRIVSYDGARLSLQAPLARHVNDKGCAFGGSLASMMTLASWGLVSLHLEQAGIDADVYVADSQIRYLAPLYGDLRVHAELAADSDWHAFTATLRGRGRARAGLLARAVLAGGDGDAATFSARYVAIVRDGGASRT